MYGDDMNINGRVENHVGIRSEIDNVTRQISKEMTPVIDTMEYKNYFRETRSRYRVFFLFFFFIPVLVCYIPGALLRKENDLKAEKQYMKEVFWCHPLHPGGLYNPNEVSTRYVLSKHLSSKFVQAPPRRDIPRTATRDFSLSSPQS